MKKSVSKMVVLTTEQTARLKAQRALIESEKDVLMEIGLQFKREHESMIAGIVSELKEARRQHGLSLADLQARTGIDRAELSRLLGDGEEPARNPTLSTLERVAAAVGRRLKLTLSER